MKKHGRFEIVLEQGQAKTPYYELPERERKEIAERLFREVTELYAKFGLKPITGEVSAKQSDKAGKVA